MRIWTSGKIVSLFNIDITLNRDWSKKEAPAKAILPSARSTSITILGAISLAGVIDISLRKPTSSVASKKRKVVDKELKIIGQLGTRSEQFLAYLNIMMDCLDRNRLHGYYLVMDNAAIHKPAAIGNLIESREYKCVYLPPYSPFLKAGIKRKPRLLFFGTSPRPRQELSFSKATIIMTEAKKIPDELALFKLPRSHQPGTDLISKLIARHQSTVDMITTELLNVKEGTYTSSNTAFTDGTECDVLYVPHSSNSPSLPPIIIEVQHTVNQTFMARAAQYCLNVFYRFHVLPVLVIFCINKIESKALASQFTPKSDKPFYLETPSNHFAEFCYLVTKGSIDRYVDDVDEDMNSIVAFGHFLLSGQQSIIGIDRWDDPTILKLYSIAKDVMDNGTNVDTAEGITSLKTICKATHDQFAKISKNIASNPERAYRYSEAGRIYSDTLKRKYDQLYESSTSDECITPMEEPADIMNLSRSTQQPAVSSVVTFVENFKKNHIGRMDWGECWEVGRKEGLFREYGNGNSLKAVYFKAIKKTGA